MLELGAFLALAGIGLGMAALAVWVGLQIYNEVTITRLNNAVVDALAEGTYRNSYRYRARKRAGK